MRTAHNKSRARGTNTDAYARDVTHAHAGLKRFSFGSSLFGCAPATGHACSPLACPTAWLAILLRRYPGACKSLMRVSRSTRDLVLSNKGHAQLTVRASHELQGDQWESQLAVVQRDLRARQRQPTRLHVQCGTDGMHADTHQLFATPNNTIVSLAVSCENNYSAHATTRLLAAPGLANVHSLHTDICPTTMPHPTALPQLRKLSFSLPMEHETHKTVLPTAVPYLPIVGSFKCAMTHDKYDRYAQVPAIPLATFFPPHATFPGLNHIHLPVPLDPVLLGLLMSHVPGLGKLGVSNVRLGPMGDVTWRVRQLTVTSDRPANDLIMYLPRLEEGRLALIAHHGDFVFIVEEEVGAACFSECTATHRLVSSHRMVSSAT